MGGKNLGGKMGGRVEKARIIGNFLVFLSIHISFLGDRISSHDPETKCQPYIKSESDHRASTTIHIPQHISPHRRKPRTTITKGDGGGSPEKIADNSYEILISEFS
jgi:hypothetical protein